MSTEKALKEEKMVEIIRHGDSVLAIIISRDFHREGVAFVTPPDSLLQLGYMSHPQGYNIIPHMHKPCHRHIVGTHEVLFIKSGRVRVNFYDDMQHFLESREIAAGDWILLMGGGHGFEMLEPTAMMEVKTGPYVGEQDKTRFSL